MTALRARLVLSALMLVHGILVVDTLLTKSVTLDETAHLPAGISYLERGSFRVFPLNGPLPRLLPALLAKTSGFTLAPLYETSRGFRAEPPNHWTFGFDLLRSQAETTQGTARYRGLFVRGRLATAALSVLTIPLLFAFARRFVGPGGGLLAAALWAFDPTAIAHGGLVTTDTCAAATTLLAALLADRLLELASEGRATGLARVRTCAAAGFGLGLALLTKFSSLWLLPTFALWAAFRLARRRPEVPLGPGRLVGGLAVVSASALLTVNAGYLFEGTGTRLGALRFSSLAFTEKGPGEKRVNRLRDSALGRLPSPLPAPFLEGLDALKLEDEAGYQQYLGGRLQREPFRSYYAHALAVKLPVATWLLLLLGSFAWLFREGDPDAARRVDRAVPLALLAGVPLLAISFLTQTALGVRYVLPIFPFLFVWAAGAVRGEEGKRPERSTPWQVAALAAACLLAVETSRVHPNELAFFNALAGGPAKGRFHLIDSNLDWGQDLLPLSRWIEEHPDWRGARLAYGGPIPPEMEGIAPHRLAPRDLRFVPPARRLPEEREDDPWSFGPQPGKFAVSVNLERGMFFRSAAPMDRLAELVARAPGCILPGTHLISHPAEAYGYFRELTPRIEPAIGYSILLYDVSPAEAARLRARLGMPALPERR